MRFRYPSLPSALPILGILLCGWLAAPEVRSAPEPITTWPTTRVHPLTYNGRPLTRDSLGNYYMVMRGANEVNVWKRDVQTSAWSNLGSVTDTALATGEGDCASIAVDGLNRIHVVFYDGPAPNLIHKVSLNGTSFGAANIIQRGVTWATTAAGGPFLHIDKDDGLHVAFVDESQNRPHYGYSGDGGTAWSVSKVTDLGGGDLGSIRPSVTTVPSGRVMVGFSSPGFRAFYSDTRGAPWTDASPANAASWSVPNCRLAASGDTVYVTGQRISPDPRGIIFSRTRGSTISWSAWEMVSSGTGADASLYLASGGGPEVVWRTYPNEPNRVTRSRKEPAWTATTLTGNENFIFPYVYWQENHRWQPGANKVSLLAPDLTNRQVYFIQLEDATYLPEGPQAPPPDPPAAPASLTAAPGDARATLTWPAASGATSYALYYTAGTTVTKAGTRVAAVTSPYARTALINGTQYAFAVAAVNAGGESPLSPVATATPQVPAPSAPGTPVAVAGDGQAAITWPAVAGAASYNLYYAAGATVSKSDTKVTGVTSPRTVSTLINATQYAFAVSAVNAGGESPLSAIATATPEARPLVTTTTLPEARVNSAYSTGLNAAGGKPPYTWSLSPGSAPLPAGLSLSGATLSGSPAAAGATDFTVRVTDSLGAYGDRTLRLTALANRKPRVTSPATATATSGQPYTYDATASDSDGNAVTLSFAGQAAWLAPSGASLQGTPPPGTASSTFRVIADDGNLRDTLAVSLAVVEGNRPPSLDSVKAASSPVPEGDSTVLRAWASDPDGDALTTIWTLDGTEVTRGTLSYTYRAGYLSAGTRAFKVRIEDGKGLWSEKTHSLPVINTPLPPECLTPAGNLARSSVLEWGWTGVQDPDLDTSTLRFHLQAYAESGLTTLLASKDSLNQRKVALSDPALTIPSDREVWIRVRAFDLNLHNSGWGKPRRYVVTGPTPVAPPGRAGEFRVWAAGLPDAAGPQFHVRMPAGRGLAGQSLVFRLFGPGGNLLHTETFRFEGPGTHLVRLGTTAGPSPSRRGPAICKVRLGHLEQTLVLPIP